MYLKNPPRLLELYRLQSMGLLDLCGLNFHPSKSNKYSQKLLLSLINVGVKLCRALEGPQKAT